MLGYSYTNTVSCNNFDIPVFKERNLQNICNMTFYRLEIFKTKLSFQFVIFKKTNNIQSLTKLIG